MLELEIPGQPQGKGRLRHRVVRSRANPMGYASGYTPAKTLKYQDLIADLARMAWRTAPLEGPIFLHVVAYMKMPKSFSRAKRAAALRGDLRPLSKPDWDNFGKVASDALNKIVFGDDAHIADAFVQKFYSESPRMRIVATSSKVNNHGCPTSLESCCARGFSGVGSVGGVSLAA